MGRAFVYEPNEVAPMSIYTRQADAPRRYFSYRWKAPLIFVSFVAIAIVCSHFQSIWEQRYPELPDIPFHLFPIAVIGAILSFGFIFAVHYALQIMMTLQIRLTEEGILRSGGEFLKDLFLPRDEIVGYTEHKNGILLRSTDPARWILVPCDLERYAHLRSELASMSIHQIGGDGRRRLWKPAFVLFSIVAILLVLTKSGHDFAAENLYVALGVAAIAYVAWRNRSMQRARQVSILLRQLFIILLLLVAAITIAHPNTPDHAGEWSYLGVMGVLGFICFISILREYRK